ncbi:hypothetical protein CPBF367_14750 [Xanthomonas arboricola pv. juglandis]|nr:hypothetical protein CPBF367_14750 [Xanthomonas arboricola pv. juglandis]
MDGSSILGLPAWPHACHRASSRTCECASPPYPHPKPHSAPRHALAARALQGTRAHGAPAVPPRPDGRGASGNFVMTAFSTFRSRGNNVPRRQRGRGLAESGTGMCRGGESDRMSDRAEEPIPGHAAALTEARDRRRTWRCLKNPYPHPNPRSAPRPALAARALQLCLLAPTGEGLPVLRRRGASSSLPAPLLSSRLSNLMLPAAPAQDRPADRRCARCRSTAARCLH